MKKIVILALCAVLVGCSDEPSDNTTTPDAIDNEDVSAIDATDSGDEPDTVESVDTADPDEPDNMDEPNDVVPGEDTEITTDTEIWVDTDDATESPEDTQETPLPDIVEEVDTTEENIPTDEVTGWMVSVPEGMFLMGCDFCDVDEAPRHPVTLSFFEIDKTEVTQSAYQACVEAGPCSVPSENFSPEERPTHPVTNVSWSQGRTFCLWANKRLPTEAEWEKAARGTDGQIYPWGDGAADCTLAHTAECASIADGALPVGSLPEGMSPYGALDMSGNVWEWVNDYYAADAYLFHDGPDPQGPATGTNRVYRGGSSGNYSELATASNRASTYNPEVGGSGLGFRCAR